MSVPLVVNSELFQYPSNRQVPGWGGDATAWAQAVTTVLGSLAGPNDILQTEANIANGQSLAMPATAGLVAGLSFDPTVVRGAKVDYNVYRLTTGSGAEELVEQGIMLISYKPVAMTWDLVIMSSQSSGVTFTISSTGQVYYTSTTMTGVNPTGSIVFRAIGLT
jgi:hypothetical protein